MLVLEVGVSFSSLLVSDEWVRWCLCTSVSSTAGRERLAHSGWLLNSAVISDMVVYHVIAGLSVLSLVTASMTQFCSHPCSAYLEGTRSVVSWLVPCLLTVSCIVLEHYSALCCWVMLRWVSLSLTHTSCSWMSQAITFGCLVRFPFVLIFWVSWEAWLVPMDFPQRLGWYLSWTWGSVLCALMEDSGGVF